MSPVTAQVSGSGDVYRPAERLVQERRDDAAVYALGVALVLGLGLHQGGHRPVLELVKAAVQAEGVVQPADKAVAAVVVLPNYLFLQKSRLQTLRPAGNS